MINVLAEILDGLSHGTPGLVVASLTLICMLLALIRKDAGLMVTTAFLFIPFSYALGAWSGVYILVRLMPIFPLLAAFAISRDETLLAWVLPLLPFGYLVYLLFSLVVSNFRRI
jgi:hypothetical protein